MLQKELVLFVYSLGLLGWVGSWYFFKGFYNSRKYPYLWIAFLFMVGVFFIEILSASYIAINTTFDNEKQLLRVVETNTRQVVIAIFGILVLSVSLSSFQKTKLVTKTFFLYMMLSLVFIVGGVLVLYWLPIHQPELYRLLRHIKTVFYLYAIGYFLGGTVLLISRLMSFLDIEPDE